MKEALSEGFRRVAGYIFGKNTPKPSSSKGGSSEKIAMTSPVVTEMVGRGSSSSNGDSSSEKIAMTSPVQSERRADGTYKVSFIMPSKYTLETIPHPHNPKVTLKQVPPRTAAALTFTGNIPSQDVVDKQQAALLAVLAAEGLQTTGDPLLLQYHPPFAPRWMRKNEVLIYVKT